MLAPHRAHVAICLLASLPVACSTVWGFDDATLGSGGAGHGGTGGPSSAGHGGALGGGGASTQGGAAGEGGLGIGGSCTTGQTQDVGGCGNCGTSRTTCAADGTWGLPVCVGEGECSAGTSEPAACGNCGQQLRVCSDSCVWGAYGACENQGVCSPGASNDCMCSTLSGNTSCCGSEVCSDTCQWDPCTLKAGKTCDWEAGVNWSCCATAGKRHWCLSSCVWSTSCVTYSGC